MKSSNSVPNNTANFHSSKAQVLFFLFACVQAFAFSLAYSENTRPFLDLSAYIAGEFRPPFQYRVLCAWLARPIVALLSLPPFADILAQRPTPFNDANHVAFILINTVGLIALVYLVKSALKNLHLSPQLQSLQNLLPFGLLLVLPSTLMTYTQANYWIVYDISGAAFFLAILVLAHRQQYLSVVLLMPIALFNRETAILAGGCICLHLLLQHKWRLSISLGFVMLIQFLIIKGLLYNWYGQKATEFGGLFEYRLWLNLAYLKNPMWWPSILSIFGLLWVPVIYWFKSIPNSVFKTTAMTFPLYFLLMIAIGQIFELRIFNEFAAIFFILFCQITFNPQKPFANTSSTD